MIAFCLEHKDRAQPWPKTTEKPSGNALDTIRTGQIVDRVRARKMVEDELQGDALATTRDELLESIDRIPHAEYVQEKKKNNAKAKRKQPASDGGGSSKEAKLM